MYVYMCTRERSIVIQFIFVIQQIVVLACVVAAANAQFGRANAFASFGTTPNPFRYKPAPPPRPVVPLPDPVRVAPRVYNGDARNANILRSGNEINPDGSYNYL